MIVKIMMNRKITKVMNFLAILISNFMFATVAYMYCRIQSGIKYEGWSVSAWAAFLYSIPFLIAIAVCLVIGKIANRKDYIRNREEK